MSDFSVMDRTNDHVYVHLQPIELLIAGHSQQELLIMISARAVGTNVRQVVPLCRTYIDDEKLVAGKWAASVSILQGRG